jgi:hypothetical protein
LYFLGRSGITPSSRIRGRSSTERAPTAERVVVSRTLDVEAANGRNYYLLDIDTDTVTVFRTVLIGKDGWLQTEQPCNSRPRPVIAPDLTVVARQLREKYGPGNAHYLHTFGTIEHAGGSEYLPLVKATTNSTSSTRQGLKRSGRSSRRVRLESDGGSLHCSEAVAGEASLEASRACTAGKK